MVPAKGYVEPELLRTLATLLKQTKERSYEIMQLNSTSKVLDVGCGPGTDTIPLGNLIGANGEIIGVDNDQNMVSEAEQLSEKAGLSGFVKHIYADASALPFKDNYFDACRSERLFQHLVNYKSALSEMVRVTKPKGRVVVLDTDWGTLSIETPEIDIERRLVRVLAERVLNNGYSGRRLFKLFKEENLSEITIEMFPTHLTSYTLMRQITLMDRVEQEALKSKVITQYELEQWHTSLEQLDASGLCFCSGSLVMVSGYKA